jgi:transcription antitermination factor NusG
MSTDVGAMDGQWFVAQVFAGRESLSATHLESRGYEVFLPCYREPLDRARRKPRSRALFSGYLFCRVRAGVFGKLVTAPGVIRIVGDGRQPLPVPDDEVASIRRIVDAELPAVPCAHVQVGERVRVMSGPLRDVEGVVRRTKHGGQLIVSVSLLRRSVAVEIDAAAVAPVVATATQWAMARVSPSPGA